MEMFDKLLLEKILVKTSDFSTFLAIKYIFLKILEAR